MCSAFKVFRCFPEIVPTNRNCFGAFLRFCSGSTAVTVVATLPSWSRILDMVVICIYSIYIYCIINVVVCCHVNSGHEDPGSDEGQGALVLFEKLCLSFAQALL